MTLTWVSILTVAQEKSTAQMEERGGNQCEKSGREGLLKKVKENALPPISWKVTPDVLLSVTGWIMGGGNQSIDWSYRNLMLN